MAAIPFYITERLLRLPFVPALVAGEFGIHAFGSHLPTGTKVMAKPYHNDPHGWVSIRFRDEQGELHEFTESEDRIAFDPCNCNDTMHVPGEASVDCVYRYDR